MVALTGCNKWIMFFMIAGFLGKVVQGFQTIKSNKGNFKFHRRCIE